MPRTRKPWWFCTDRVCVGRLGKVQTINSFRFCTAKPLCTCICECICAVDCNSTKPKRDSRGRTFLWALCRFVFFDVPFFPAYLNILFCFLCSSHAVFFSPGNIFLISAVFPQWPPCVLGVLCFTFKREALLSSFFIVMWFALLQKRLEFNLWIYMQTCIHTINIRTKCVRDVQELCTRWTQKQNVRKKKRERIQ